MRYERKYIHPAGSTGGWICVVLAVVDVAHHVVVVRVVDLDQIENDHKVVAVRVVDLEKTIIYM